MSTDSMRPDNRGALELLDRAASIARRQRLFNGSAPAPKPKSPRPLSPFDARRLLAPSKPSHRLFLRVIEPLDDNGNIVIPGLFTPQWKQIARQVAAKHGVSVTDLLSARRDRPVAVARHEAFYRCRHETTLSLPEIGRRFGGRDHTTVLHGVRMHEQRMRQSS